MSVVCRATEAPRRADVVFDLPTLDDIFNVNAHVGATTDSQWGAREGVAAAGGRRASGDSLAEVLTGVGAGGAAGAGAAGFAAALALGGFPMAL